MNRDEGLQHLLNNNIDQIKTKIDYLAVYLHRYLLSEDYIPINNNQILKIFLTKTGDGSILLQYKKDINISFKLLVVENNKIDISVSSEASRYTTSMTILVDNYVNENEGNYSFKYAELSDLREKLRKKFYNLISMMKQKLINNSGDDCNTDKGQHSTMSTITDGNKECLTSYISEPSTLSSYDVTGKNCYQILQLTGNLGGDNPCAGFYGSVDDDANLGFTRLDSSNRIKQDPPTPTIKDLLVPLEDCYRGGVIQITINRQVTNDGGITSSIQEKLLSITIPRGCLPGTQVTVEGEGDQGPNNIPSNLVIIVKDKPHLYFRRENADLIYTAKINLGEALAGVLLHIEHLDGRKLSFPFTEIIKPGYSKRIPGQGMPLMTDSDKYGDLIFEFDVEYPRQLDSVQKLYIREALCKKN